MKMTANWLKLGLLYFWILIPVAFAQDSSQAVSMDAGFIEILNRFKATSVTEKEEAVNLLVASQHPKALSILQGLSEGHLMILKAQDQVVITTDLGDAFLAIDPFTQKELGQLAKTDLAKINLTNKLRTLLHKAINQLQLNSNDAEERYKAVQSMMQNQEDLNIELFRELFSKEQNPKVKEALITAIALYEIHSDDKAVRIQALQALTGINNQAVVNQLNAIAEKDNDGNYLEPDKDIVNLAETALAKIKLKLQLFSAIETVFFGLSLGAVLVLTAIGLAITFGVMGVINMAHGELMMLGAYTAYVMQQLMPGHLGVSLLLSIPAAFCIAGLAGIAIERSIIRFLYGRPLETLLATFGVSLFLQQTVRTVFSPLNRSVATPEWLSGSWQINDFLSLTWNRFFILVFCLLVFVVLLQTLKHTRLGLEVRAVAQNRNMAKAMGIPTSRVDAMTFGLGSGIAGIAGVALSQITNVGPNLGQAYIVDSFMVVVFGGVGNLWGTLVAGFSLGIANKFLEPYAGAVLAKILVLVFIILFIQKRPRGLFPQKGRAAEV